MKITSPKISHNLQFRSLFLLMLALLVLPSSCTKESLKEQEEIVAPSAAPSTEEAPPERYEYYLDSQQVQEGTFDPQDQNLIVDVSGEEDPLVEGGALYKIWAFTTEANYVNWGDTHGLPVACHLEIGRHLADYARQIGAIAYYEQTGEALPQFEHYANDYINQMNCNGQNSQFRTPSAIYKNHWGGPGAIIPSFTSFMYPGWNNTVSRYYTFGIYNAMTVYDKVYYRKRLATLWNWGWSYWRFHYGLSWLDNKMSSAIVL